MAARCSTCPSPVLVWKPNHCGAMEPRDPFFFLSESVGGYPGLGCVSRADRKRPRSGSLAAAVATPTWPMRLSGVPVDRRLSEVLEGGGGRGNHRGALSHRNWQSKRCNNCWSFSLELNFNPPITFKVFPRWLQIQILIELTFILMKHVQGMRWFFFCWALHFSSPPF